MTYTFLVVDFDGTNQPQRPASLYGIPRVYLVPQDRLVECENLARQAGDEFLRNGEWNFIGWFSGRFRELLNLNGITYRYVGLIGLSYAERQNDYLADSIARVVI